MTTKRWVLWQVVVVAGLTGAPDRVSAQFFPSGACCTSTGTCTVTTSINCFGQQGIFQGSGTSCAGLVCSGACCTPLGDCFDTGSTGCQFQLGTFQGLGSTCAAAAGQCVGACCQGTGACTETGPLGCSLSGGAFHGLTTTCAAFGPSCMGACCDNDGMCMDTGPLSCSSVGGAFQGNGSACGETDCNGACCLPDGICAMMSVNGCADAAGVFNGLGTNCSTAVCPLGTHFTYQGQLKENGRPMNGDVDLEFTLWDGSLGGMQLGETFALPAVQIVNGLFTVRIDFGVEVFNGRAAFLQVAVRAPAGSGTPYVALVPRQLLTASPYALQTRGIFVDEAGLVGIGTSQPAAKLHVDGGTDTAPAGGGFAQFGSSNGANLAIDNDEIMARQNGQAARLYINHEGGDVLVNGQGNGRMGIGTSSPQTMLHVVGTVRSDILEVVGGADIAEPYVVAAAGNVIPQPGMVVVIDPDSLGGLRLAETAYDTRVAGIISGANGINPGLTLRQSGTVADGELPVASMGRVWCMVDAEANGPVKAGDLLTTSNTPGHAMRADATHDARAAVIGKAMSSLSGGKGLVLVLVSLQ